MEKERHPASDIIQIQGAFFVEIQRINNKLIVKYVKNC